MHHLNFEVYTTDEAAANNETTQDLIVEKEIKSISNEYVKKQDATVESTSTILASIDDVKEEKLVSTSKIIVQEQDAVVLENLKRVSETKPVEIKGFSSKNAGGGSGLGLLILVLLAIAVENDIV